MSTARLALRNTKRSWKRSLLTATAIAIAVGGLTFYRAYLTGMFQSFNETTVRLSTGEMQIKPVKGVGRVRALPLEDGIKNVNGLVDSLEQLPGILQVSPRISFGVLLDKDKGAIPAAGMGHDPERETHLMKMAEMVSAGRLPAQGSNEALVGDSLAHELGLALGDELFIVANTSYGGLGPGLYKIVGMMHTGISMIDKKTFHVPLQPIQEQLVMDDMAVDIALALDGGVQAAREMKPKIRALLDEMGRDDLAVLTWKEASVEAGVMDQADSMTSLFTLLIGIVAFTTVVNTVLMSVMERIREFGALRALGFTRPHVMRIVLFETMILGIAGTVVGVVLGMGIAKWLNIVGLDFSAQMSGMDLLVNPIIRPVPNMTVAMYAGFFGAMVSIIAAWYPARVAVRIAPATALGRQQ